MGENDLSGRVGLDTTDFKSSISTLNREIRVVESGFRAAAAGMADWAANASGLEMRVKALTDQIGLQQRKVDALGAEYQRVAAESGETSRAAQDLQIKLNKETEALNKMQGELGQTNGKLKAMKDESKDAARGVKDLDTQQDKAVKSTKKLGDEEKKTETKTHSLKGALHALGSAAKLGAGMLAATAGAALAVAAGVARMVGQATRAAGELVDLSLQTGIGVERLQELRYVGEQTGTSLETMTGSMAKLVRSMSDAGTNDAMAANFERLGVATVDANGNLRDSEAVFGDVINALGGVSNEAERDALAMEIFGKSAQELNPLILAGADGIADLSAEARDMGAVMDEDAVNGLESFGDSLASLKTGLMGTMGTLSTAFLPAFQGLADEGGGYLSRFANLAKNSLGTGNFTGLAAGLGDIFGDIVESIAGQAPKMLEAALGILQALMTGLIQQMPVIIPAVFQMITSLIQFVAQMAPMLLTAGINMLVMLMQGLTTSIPLLIQTVATLIPTMVITLLEALPMLIQSAIEMILAIVNGLIEALPTLIEYVPQIITAVLNALLGALPMLLSAAVEIIVALVNGLVTAIPMLVEMIPDIITAIIDTIIELLPMIGDAAVEIVMALIDGIGELLPVIGSAAGAAGKIVTSLVEGVVALASRLLTVGRNIVSGIWEGIQARATWFANQIRGFFTGIIDGIKDALGIESPSTVFAGIGSNMAAGLGIGFSKSFAAIEDRINTAVSGMTTGLNMVAAGGMGGGANVNTTIYANVASQVDIHVLARRVAEEFKRL